jgi:hypothetical protein
MRFFLDLAVDADLNGKLTRLQNATKGISAFPPGLLMPVYPGAMKATLASGGIVEEAMGRRS